MNDEIETARAMLNKHLAAVFLVIFGATANALAQLSLARKEKSPFDCLDFVIALFISAFAGTMFGMGATYFLEESNILTHAIAAMGAFLGLKGMNQISDAVLTVLSEHIKKEK